MTGSWQGKTLVKRWGTEALTGGCPYRFSKRVNGEVVWCRCRKCLRCVRLRQSVLVGQMMAETASHTSSAVFTLTFDEAHYERLMPDYWEKSDLLKFNAAMLQRIRRHWPEWSGKYYVTWEIGAEFGRVHCHLVLFGIPFMYTRKATVSVPWWTFGRVQADKMSAAAARYVAAYVSDPEKRKLKLHSRGSAKLGYRWIRQFLETVALERKWPGAVYKFTGREFLPGPFFEVNFVRYPLPLEMFNYAVSLGLDVEWEPVEVGDLHERMALEGEFDRLRSRLDGYQAQKPLTEKYLQDGFYSVVRR